MRRLTEGASGFGWGSLPLHADSVEGAAPTAAREVSDFELGLPGSAATHCYPGQRPQGSFVVLGNCVLAVRPSMTASGWQIHETDGRVEDLNDWLARNGQPALGHRLTCIAYGSNLNPQQIAGFAGGRAVVVLRALTVGIAAAYCSTRRRDGQFPAGVVAVDAMHVEEHGVLLLDPGQVDALDAKEGEGTRYARVRVRHRDAPAAAALENGTVISPALPIYLQGHPRPLAVRDGEPVLVARAHQRDFDDGRSCGESHDHGLDVQPLERFPRISAEPIPVFAYGTLQPEQWYWPQVRDHIARHEPATLTGCRFDTGHGYPGLHLDHPQSEPVVGTLLHPRPGSHHAAIRAMDRIEGHPHLYARSLVRIDDGRLAWTYVWAAD